MNGIEKIKKRLKKIWKRKEKNRIKGKCEVCDNYSTELKKWEGKWTCPECRRQEIGDLKNQKKALSKEEVLK